MVFAPAEAKQIKRGGGGGLTVRRVCYMTSQWRHRRIHGDYIQCCVAVD